MAHSANCPRCEKPVDLEWRFCPNCEAVLHGPERGSRGGNQHRAMHAVLALPENRIVLVLAIAGIIGLSLIVLVIGIAVMLSYGSGFGCAFVFGAFLILTFGLVVYQRLNEDELFGRVVKAIVVGALAFAGGLMIMSCTFGGLVLLIQRALP
jgi:hypothetical protein